MQFCLTTLKIVGIQRTSPRMMSGDQADMTHVDGLRIIYDIREETLSLSLSVEWFRLELLFLPLSSMSALFEK